MMSLNRNLKLTGLVTGWSRSLAVVIAGLFALAFAVDFGISVAAAQDSVFLLAGSPVRGEISDSTSTTIIVKTDKGEAEVPVQNIRSLTFGKEPPEYDKAKRAFDRQKYDEGLAELDKLKEDAASGMLAQELDYLRALGNARSALSGGAVTAKNAGTAVNAFLKKYPSSWHFFELTELLGELLVAVGRSDLADAEYAKLASSPLPQYQLRGSFNRAQALLLAGDGAGAEKSFEAVIASALNDEAAVRMKSLAGCLKAKAQLLQGKREEAQVAVMKLIKNEDPKQTELFANAYNILGLCHQEAGQNQEAVLAFLHTDLLFSNQAAAHAEALYYLAQLWPKLDKNDRALEARTSLKSLYRNSVWANKLEQ
jgi:tetratricopeptide (TPR) repeat protein